MTTGRDGPADEAIATSSQTVGPFFHFGLAADPALGTVAAPGTCGERIQLHIRVLDADGLPVPDALVELYQADADGRYPPSSARAVDGFTGFGRLPTAEDGSCVFDTIRPGGVATEGGTRQAAHVNVCVFARGLLRHLYTRIYFDADPALADDPLLSLVPAGRRRTLLARRRAGDPATWDFTIRLQGDDETVFFDL
jgi:protocatechuate 3,4-dioxygenase alpha subunit